ncbi:MAG: hemoglobin/transferrin/lactoferrin receptor protein [Halieaceae bacterium]|jgi:hemoglobin/transferrin/lactoferrin receptor protein
MVILITHISVSQELKVYDYSTKLPIIGVHVYSMDMSKTTITDSSGSADITLFSDDDLIIFSHTSYAEVLFKKKDLYTSYYVLELHPTVLNLDEFVLSVNKRFQVKEEVPNRIVSVTAKDIRLNDPQTSADLIASSGEVFVQKSQLGGGSPMIRGFSANKVLLVVDGVRMNNAIFRGGNIQNIISIDPNTVEKSEIVFGPGSVIYGSDAMGGVMDFQTLTHKYSDTGNTFNGHAMFRFSSANQELTPHVDIRFGSNIFSSVTSLSFSKFSDMRMGANGPDEYLRKDYVSVESGVDKMVENTDPEVQKFTGYENYSLLQKFGLKFNEHVKLDYSLLYSTTTDIPRYDRLTQRKNESTLKYARWEYGPQKWMMNRIGLNINAPNSIFDNLRVTLAMQNFEESRIDRKFNDPLGRTRTETVDMFSANLDFDNAISGKTTLFYGFESVFNLIGSLAITDSLGVVGVTNTRYPNDSRYYSNSGYLNIQVNHSKKTSVSYGLRYNHIGIIAQLDTVYYKSPETASIDQNTGALTGSIGMAYRPNTTWQLNANASSGFKAPNIDDMAKVFDSQPGLVVVPNTGLRPEYLYSIDVLAAKTFGASKQFSVEFSGFYSYLVDAMVQRPFEVNGEDSIMYDGTLSEVQALVNVGSAFITGFNLGVSAKLTQNLSTKGSVTYTYGKDNEGFYLRHVSPLFANAHIIYNYKKFRVNVYANYNGEISNNRMSPTELAKDNLYIADSNGGLYAPSWYTLNIKSAIFFSKKMMATFGVENITNTRYRPYSSGIASSGINFIGSIKATF